MATRKRGRTWPLIVACGAMTLVVLLAGLAAPHLGTFLAVSDQPVAADATALTYSVSTVRVLLDEAGERYRRGDGPVIVVGDLAVEGANKTVMPRAGSVAREYLLAQGIPSEAIDVLQGASSENEEILHLRQEAQAHGWHRVVAYVLARHARRSTAAFKHAFIPIGVEVRVVALPEPVLEPPAQSFLSNAERPGPLILALATL